MQNLLLGEGFCWLDESVFQPVRLHWRPEKAVEMLVLTLIVTLVTSYAFVNSWKGTGHNRWLVWCIVWYLCSAGCRRANYDVVWSPVLQSMLGTVSKFCVRLWLVVRCHWCVKKAKCRDKCRVAEQGSQHCSGIELLGNLELVIGVRVRVKD